MINSNIGKNLTTEAGKQEEMLRTRQYIISLIKGRSSVRVNVRMRLFALVTEINYSEMDRLN